MSYKLGIAAINLEMTDKVPRTEFSVRFHWQLIKKVTGIDTDIIENRKEAIKAFDKAWDFALSWSTPVYRNYLNNGRRTSMGHSLYIQDFRGFDNVFVDNKNEEGSDYDPKKNTPFNSIDEIYDIDFYQEYGEFDQQKLIRAFNEHYQNQLVEHPDTVNMGGVYITLFTGLIEILGWDLMLQAMFDEKKFDSLIKRYYEWVKQFFIAYAKTDIPVFMSHDDIVWANGPIMNPVWYRKYVFPRLKDLFSIIKESGKKLLYTCDGNYSAFLDDIVECGPDMLFMEPSTDMQYFADKYGTTHGFCGNADTRVLLEGNKEDIYAEVKRCMDIGKKYPGYVMSVGNHIAPNTPVDACLYYNDAYEKLSCR